MIAGAGIAYLDPGNLESQLQAGAQAGYTLMWVLMWVIIMVSSLLPLSRPPVLQNPLCWPTPCSRLCLHVRPCRWTPRQGCQNPTRVHAQGYLMQMLSVKLGVATGLNLAQHCRYQQAPAPNSHAEAVRPAANCHGPGVSRQKSGRMPARAKWASKGRKVQAV